ncbi:hypothetical protein pb186bvf_019534 [Paramecium bursaria]
MKNIDLMFLTLFLCYNPYSISFFLDIISVHMMVDTKSKIFQHQHLITYMQCRSIFILQQFRFVRKIIFKSEQTLKEVMPNKTTCIIQYDLSYFTFFCSKVYEIKNQSHTQMLT